MNLRRTKAARSVRSSAGAVDSDSMGREDRP